jgi:hypothetical protein
LLRVFHSAICNLQSAILCCLLVPGSAVGGVPVRLGDVSVEVKKIPQREGSHGYSEFLFEVANHSTQKAHKVTLGLPRYTYMRSQDYVKELRRTVDVGPATLTADKVEPTRVLVSILQPDNPVLGGSELSVTVDGKTWDRTPDLPLNSSYGRGYGSRRHSPGTSNGPLVLVSPGVTNQFGIGNQPFENAAQGQVFNLSTWARMDPMQRQQFAEGRKPSFDTGFNNVQFLRVSGPDPAPTDGATRWLALSRYDGVVITAQDLQRLRTKTPEAWTALVQYTEAGGALLIFGPWTVPENWGRRRRADPAFTIYEAGFGQCLVCERGTHDGWDLKSWELLFRSWADTAGPWQRFRTLSEANRDFPVVDDVSVPVRGLFVIMLLFAVALGPVNLYLLSRWRRRIWMLWTVPGISLATCLLVLGYVLASEGWHASVRTETLTVLDESAQRASTIGWTSYYSPMNPGDGLKFSDQTELTYQKFEEYGRGSSACVIDWSTDQHLTRGWISARVPAPFMLRKSEPSRLRVTVHKGRDGALTVTNKLGADVRQLWYADAEGKLYQAENVPFEAEVALRPTGEGLPDGGPKTGPRDVYAADWLNKLHNLPKRPADYLTPRSYLAVVDTTPFVEEALAGARPHGSRSLVLGLMKKEAAP